MRAAILLAAVCGWSGGAFAASEFDASQEVYNAVMARGMLEFGIGNYDNSFPIFASAAKLNLFEYPNYVPYLYMGLSKCMTGKHEDAKSLLSDFDCMTQVASGKLHCAAENRNSSLTEMCARTMCGALYESYYEKPSLEELERIANLQRVEKLYRASCEWK